MIKVSVLYPHKTGAKFDMDYYCDSHMPLVQSKLKPALKGMAVDKGLAGGTPGAPPAYVAMCHLWFDSVAAFEGAFEPAADTILADIPNYTDIEPVLQISEVMLD
ncbi:MAG TPA: EthD family reductase [Gammaproteobacteria bacterium]|nr:EthD family reductase [Gammaproteobacteria bacterium]